MLRRRNRTLGAATALLILCLLSMYLAGWRREPTYNGHTFDEWGQALWDPLHPGPSGNPDFKPGFNEVREAIRQLGKPHLPKLTRQLAYEPARDPFISGVYNLPKGPARLLPWNLVREARVRNLRSKYKAYSILMTLGPEAAPAVPHLRELVRHGNEETVNRALAVLQRIGEPAIPTLVAEASSPAAAIGTRVKVLETLGDFETNPTIIRCLTDLLHDPAPSVRQSATTALARQRAQQEPQ